MFYGSMPITSCKRYQFWHFRGPINIDIYIFTRQLRGKRDLAGIEKKQFVQKQLFLCNLKEPHAAFKGKHPEMKMSFLIFASLHPKKCKTVSPKGSQSACVCSIYQNEKFEAECHRRGKGIT